MKIFRPSGNLEYSKQLRAFLKEPEKCVFLGKEQQILSVDSVNIYTVPSKSILNIAVQHLLCIVLRPTFYILHGRIQDFNEAIGWKDELQSTIVLILLLACKRTQSRVLLTMFQFLFLLIDSHPQASSVLQPRKESESERPNLQHMTI